MAGLRLTEEQLAQLQNRNADLTRASTRQSPARTHKFDARGTTVDGFRFPSKAEAAYYTWSKYALMIGVLKLSLRQVPFHLPGNVICRVDFMEIRADGEVTFIDVKGYVTPAFRRNWKQVRQLYGVEIKAVKHVKGWDSAAIFKEMDLANTR